MKALQIQKLEFLSESEKLELPILIEQYKKFCIEKEFSLINEEISKFVSPKRSSAESWCFNNFPNMECYAISFIQYYGI